MGMARDFSVVAEELVHDVGIFVAKEDAEVQVRGLGDARHRRKLAIDITAPSFGNGQDLLGTVRKNGDFAKKCKVLVR